MALVATLDFDVGSNTVEFTLAVTNSGTEAVTLQFRSGRTATFEVAGADGVVWRSTDDRMFTQALRTDELAPGETLTETATWNEPRPGSYTVEATLDATDRDVAVRESFDY